MSNDRWSRLAAIAALLAVPVVAPILLHARMSRTYVPSGCISVKVAAKTDGEAFSLDVLAKRGGHPVHGGERFSQVEGGDYCETIDGPMSARGRTRLPDSARVWTLLANGDGKYYLQYPPVQISAGQWVAANLRPGHGIARILFVEADAGAARAFTERAEHRDWSGFPELPGGVRELASLKLE